MQFEERKNSKVTSSFNKSQTTEEHKSKYIRLFIIMIIDYLEDRGSDARYSNSEKTTRNFKSYLQEGSQDSEAKK